MILWKKAIFSCRYSGVTLSGSCASFCKASIHSRPLRASSQYVNSLGVLCAENSEENVWWPEHRQIPFAISHRTDLLFRPKMWWELRFRETVVSDVHHSFAHTWPPLIFTAFDQSASAFFESTEIETALRSFSTFRFPFSFSSRSRRSHLGEQVRCREDWRTKVFSHRLQVGIFGILR